MSNLLDDFEDLPEIDVAIISHNHYDHLDKQSIKKLSNRVVPTSP